MKDKLIEKMYEISKKPYQKWFKKNLAWNLTIKDLMLYPKDSLGFELGEFLKINNFEIQEKLEDHDVIHVLTNTGTSVLEEIGMQFYLLGNRKKSLYLVMVITSGLLFYPTKCNYFLQQYKRGKSAHKFHQLNFLKLLNQETIQLQKTLNIQ